jgi:hypothetical protein
MHSWGQNERRARGWPPAFDYTGSCPRLLAGPLKRLRSRKWIGFNLSRHEPPSSYLPKQIPEA